MNANRLHKSAVRVVGFSLIELLVVLGVIVILLALLLPGLSSARRSARAVVCKSNLRSIMEAMHVYGGANSDAIVPSYNMTGVATGLLNPLDGWAPILDKTACLIGSQEFRDNPFCCPDTLNRSGISAMQTGTDPDNPKGFMDWPAVVTLSQNFPVTIPASGFDKIIRTGYWINGDNPIGIPQVITQALHFTTSVGYGPDPSGQTARLCFFTRIKKPAELIAFSDGLYSGKQERTHKGDVDSRIGYRHGSERPGVANLAFADGHVGQINGLRFPRKWTPDFPLDEIRRENLGADATVYADPAGALQDP